MAHIIEVRNIRKSYGKHVVLQDISFSIKSGEILSIVGSSGSGKSTILKILSGMTEDFEGRVFYDGTDVTKTSMRERKFIMMFQDFQLFPHMSVFDNVAFGLKMEKFPKERVKTEVEEYLELVELTEHRDKYPSELSGGQKQRVALIRALAVKPRLLLLDEPFSSLDTRLRETLRESTFSLIKKFKIPTVFVTHDIKEAMSSADTLAILKNGDFVAFDSPKVLYEDPKNMETAEILYGCNVFEGRVVPPENIELVSGDDYEVVEKSYIGGVYKYKVSGDETYRVFSQKEFEVGGRVGILIKKVLKLEEE